jgi:hypothetical protein
MLARRDLTSPLHGPTRSRRLRGAAVGVAAAIACASSLAAATSAHAASLTTTFASNNGFAGNTFDLVVFPANAVGVRVTSLDVNLVDTGSEAQVQVWTRPGSSAGFTNNDPSGWTHRGTTAVTPAGADNPTSVPVSFSLPNGSYGVLVAGVGNSSSMRYTNGSDTFEDDALRLTSAAGLGTPVFGGGSVFANRIWNGTIHYEIEVTPPPPEPPPSPPPEPPAGPPGDIGDEVRIVNRFAANRRATRVRRLLVRGVPDGATVQARCAGRGCTFRGKGRKRARVFRNRQGVNLGRLLRGRRLRPGAQIVLRVRRAGDIGVFVRYRVRRGRVAKVTRCLPPGSARPRQSCG